MTEVQRELLGVLPLYLVDGAFCVQSSDVAQMSEADYERLRLRADLLLSTAKQEGYHRGRLTARGKRQSLVRALLQSWASVRRVVDGQHIRLYKLTEATLEALNSIEAMGGQVSNRTQWRRVCSQPS